MRDILTKIIELQAQYNASNTPAMNKRGTLIRNDLRDALDENRAILAQTLAIPEEDLIIEGRDGTGQKSKVPWTRLGSKLRAPSANSGWYIVFLFRPQSDGVYLCLSHAATVWNGVDYVPRPETEMAPLMNWARELLADESDTNNWVEKIDLDKANRLAASYEKSTALAKFYDIKALPNNETLSDDILGFAKALGKIYSQEDKGRSPNEAYQELETTQSQIRNAQAGRIKRGKSQGFGLTGPERKAVEMLAMDAAKEFLEAEGFSVKDVSATEPCDYLATKKKVKIYVEVKGTTGLGQAVNLTKNEVKLHKARYPNTMLIILSHIDLDKMVSPPIATGGKWKIQDDQLTALSFQYIL